MKSRFQEWLRRHLVRLALACYRRSGLTLVMAGLVFASGITLASIGLNLKMDWTYLFHPNDPVVARVDHHRQAFPYPGDIAVFVDRGLPAQREAYLEALAERLRQEPHLFHHIYYKLDLTKIRSKALFYLEREQLEQLATEMERMETTEASPIGPTSRRVLGHLLAELEQSLTERGRFVHQPLWEVLGATGDERIREYTERLIEGQTEIYHTIGDGRINVLALKAGGRGEVLAPQHELVRRLRSILDELAPTAYGLRIRLTGLPVMLSDERATCTRDSIRSATLSLILIAGLFMWGFGEPKRPVLAVLALACGLGWTMGYTTLAIGHLNFITVGMVTMLMGLGIDFGIHLIFRFSEELRQGLDEEQALAKTVAGTGLDTMVGAVATSAAFFALTLANFRGQADLGWIAGGGVLLCFLATVTVLPALLSLLGRGRLAQTAPSPLLSFEETFLRNPRRIVLAGLLVCLVGLAWATQVTFDYNLLKVQAQELESVRTEVEIVRELKASVLSATSLAPDLEEARRRQAEFEKLPVVARVSSIVPLIPEEIEAKRPLVQRVLAQVDSLYLPDKLPVNGVDELRALETRVEQFKHDYPTGEGELSEQIERLRGLVNRMDPGPIEDGLGAFQDAVHDDLRVLVNFLRDQSEEPPTLDDIPEALRIRFVSPDGKVQLNILPKENIWEKEALESFLEQAQAVDPALIGHPVVQNHILKALSRAHRVTIWFTLVGVLLVMSLYLDSLEEVFLTLLPTAVGVICILGAMGYGSVDFNAVNFVALPISVGIGVVYGVHALRRIKELGHEAILSSSTGAALMLSGLTTVVGFASLMTAQHRGLNSLGFVISVGVAANFLVSLILLPALYRVARVSGRLRRLRRHRRQTQITEEGPKET